MVLTVYPYREPFSRERVTHEMEGHADSTFTPPKMTADIL